MTQEEITQLKDLCNSKLTAKQIAEKLGKSYNEIRYQIRRNHLSTTVPWERDLTEARKIARYSDKHGIKSACIKYKLPVHTIKNIRSRVRKKSSEVSPKYLETIRKRAILFGHTKQLGELSQDFASYCVIRAIEAGKKICIDYCYKDYRDKEFGNIDFVPGEAKRLAFKNSIEIGEDVEEGQMQIASEESIYEDKRIIRIANQLKLKQENRIFFILRYHYGFNLLDLAYLFNLSVSRMSYVDTEILAEVLEHSDINK